MRTRWVKRVSWFLLAYVLGVCATVVVVYVVYLDSRPDLRPWHTARLESEFRAGSAAKTLAEYLAIEDAVYRELRVQVYDRAEDKRKLNRYFAGSLSDPTAYPQDWNRTFELVPPAPKGAVLLLHGLSDSPYSLRAIGERLHAEGYRVLGLRLPGHGTAPSGLVDATWQDWAAATRLATRHLRAAVGPDRPLVTVGYSNGGALAVEHELAHLGGEDLPRVDRLVLFSPAIGVSPAAAAAVWQSRLARLPGMDKLAWNAIGPEYDPYKYVSFAVNAGDQAHRLTGVIAARFAALDKGEGVKGFARTIAFQSLIDATITARALADVMFSRLANEGHALVVYDINREAEVGLLLTPFAENAPDWFVSGPPRRFATTLLANANADSREIVAINRSAGSSAAVRETTGLVWPGAIFSLSHVALPFSPEDPLYGAKPPASSNALYLGQAELRGERGLLTVGAADLMRLRHNPFYAYQERRVLEFLAAR